MENEGEKEYTVYKDVKLVHSTIEHHAIVGEGSYIEYSKLHHHVQLNRRNILSHVEVGAYTYTGANTIIKQANIGKFCSISWNVSIAGNVHDYNEAAIHPFARLKSFGFINENLGMDSKTIIIGNDVWIGMNACILPGICIGDGAIVGAGSVVTKDVPPYMIVAGNPAKPLKARFSDDIIKALQKASWWDWPEEVIAENLTNFYEPMRLEVAEKLINLRETLHNDCED